MALQSELAPRLRAGLRALGLSPSPELERGLLDYLELLQRWNRAYNLTAVREPEAMLGQHLFDSLAVRAYIRGARIVDVGTGAGLPGIPLALAIADSDWTLVDSRAKKLRFVDHAIRRLGLTNARTEQARIEALAGRARFDCVVARALAPLERLVELIDPLLAPGGRLVALKGARAAEELMALDFGRWQAIAHDRLTVPEVDAERAVLVLARRTLEPTQREEP